VQPREYGPLTADKTSYGSDSARVGIWTWRSAKVIERQAGAQSIAVMRPGGKYKTS
jgi:hypothetical protein